MIATFLSWFEDRALAFSLLHLLLAGLGLIVLWCRGALDAMLLGSRIVLATLLVAPVLLLVGQTLVPETARLSVSAPGVDAEMVARMALSLGGEVGSISHGEVLLQPIDWKRAVVFVWVVGALLAMCKLGADLLMLHRHLSRLPKMITPDVVKLGSQTASQFRLDSTASGPYSVGLVRRFLVFPPNLLAETPHSRLQCMVRHEDCHLRHRDSVDTLLWRVLGALYWWNPLVHLAGKRVNELQEWRADTVSVGADPHRACELSRILIDQVSLARPRPLIQLMAACSARSLKRRVQRLLCDSKRPDCSTGPVKVLWFAVLLAASGTHVACTSLLPSTMNVADLGGSMGINARASEEAEVIVEIEERLSQVKNASNTDDLVAIEMKFFEMSEGEKVTQGIKFEGREKPVAAPQTTVLTPEQVESLLHNQLKQPSTTQVSYPRVLTVNKRLVTIRSVVNEPIRTLQDPDTGESSIEYLPIGTVINAAPVILKSGKIHCEFNLTVSSLIGERLIGGTRFPIASNRIYSAPLVMEPGHSVYIRGLDEALSSATGHDKLLSVLITVTRVPKAEAGVEFAE